MKNHNSLKKALSSLFLQVYHNFFLYQPKHSNFLKSCFIVPNLLLNFVQKLGMLWVEIGKTWSKLTYKKVRFSQSYDFLCNAHL